MMINLISDSREYWVGLKYCNGRFLDDEDNSVSVETAHEFPLFLHDQSKSGPTCLGVGETVFTNPPRRFFKLNLSLFPLCAGPLAYFLQQRSMVHYTPGKGTSIFNLRVW